MLPAAQPELEISIASDGMSKGISQTTGPQLVARGTLAWDHIYVAALAKNVTAEHAEAELQYTIGGSFAWAGTDLAGYLTYKRGITSIGNADEHSVEFGIGASHQIGKLSPRVQIVFSPDDLGSATTSLFVELGADWDLGRRIKIGGSFGRRERGSQVDYNFANLGASYALSRRFSADLRGYATTKESEGDRYKPRLVAAIRARF